MSYHDLSECTLSPDERRAEATNICAIIINTVSVDDDLTKAERDFFYQIQDGGGPVSVKQLFWLRDIKDKYL